MISGYVLKPHIHQICIRYPEIRIMHTCAADNLYIGSNRGGAAEGFLTTQSGLFGTGIGVQSKLTLYKDTRA